MAGPVTNFIYRALRTNDDELIDPLIDAQLNGEQFYVRAFAAAVQILASTINLVATSIFAVLSAFTGFICRGAGELQTGNDLIQSAAVAFLGDATPSLGKTVSGAVQHTVYFGLSIANLASVGLIPVCVRKLG